MKKDWKYLLYLFAAIGLFVVIKLFSPKQFDWTVTFAPKDKNPYGGYVLNELLPRLFPGKKLETSWQTIYELKDSLKTSGNILVLTREFSCDKADTKALLAFINKGGSALISAETYYGEFADTLGLTTTTGINVFAVAAPDYRDTIYLKFQNPSLDTASKYYFRKDNAHYYFDEFDTTRCQVVTRDQAGQAVTLKVRWGAGSIIVNTTPLVFTNVNMIASNNHEFISKTFSNIPVEDLLWTGFYHYGRQEISSPLRYILSSEPLRWAYYLTIIFLVTFMIFEMKRKQRIIPVVKPLENTTLEFVSTIGNLYYQNKEHKNIAEKKILFFFEQIRTKYWLNTLKTDAAFLETLTRKSGRPPEQVQNLFQAINKCREKSHLSSDELLDLNRQLEEFNKYD